MLMWYITLYISNTTDCIASLKTEVFGNVSPLQDENVQFSLDSTAVKKKYGIVVLLATKFGTMVKALHKTFQVNPQCECMSSPEDCCISILRLLEYFHSTSQIQTAKN